MTKREKNSYDHTKEVQTYLEVGVEGAGACPGGGGGG